MQVSMPGNAPAQRRTRARALFTSVVYFKSTVWAFLLGILSLASHASTGEVTLTWDPVADERVALYELHYGQQSGQFNSQVDSTTTTATVTGLTEGQTYYFAVNACDEERTLCSAFSNEVSATLAVAGLSASFSADPTTGVAPLTANFTDQSSGEITDWLWDFGDGTQSASQSPSHVYMEPGTYTVSLTISGPGGSDTQTQTDLVDVGWSPPVADFSVSPSSGWAPLVVTFSDASSGNITDWLWNFGDGSTSTATDAIHQYDAPGSYTVALTVTGPGGSDAVTKSDVVVVTGPPPTASFTTDVRSGPAALVVPFTDLSSGQISSWQWSFGDGTDSSEPSPIHTYTEPGFYSVTLTVTGSGGSDTLTETDFVQVTDPIFAWEAGELTVDDVWQRVDFAQTYSDPVVVAKPLSEQDGGDKDPAVVRLDGIDNAGFWIRIQEWDYLDGSHPPEAVSYLVMESGSHQLPDGTQVEAGRLEVQNTGNERSATGAFAAVDFSQPFSTAPVVLTSVGSFVETDAVTTRVRKVTEGGFEVGMSEQEANAPVHAAEDIYFIAWAVSAGNLGGLRYEVGLSGVAVDHRPYSIGFGSGFLAPPLFLADMQTTNDADPANLRLKRTTTTEARVKIEEERSKNKETRRKHKEAVGYVLLEVR